MSSTSSPREGFTLGHRRCLDGIRGMAILMLLLCHIPKLPFFGGFIGVDLFFVLSGFLITSLLMEEWQKTGTVNLRAFYARRALRLLPALLAMLVVSVGLSAAVEPPAAAKAMASSAAITLLYSANWFLAFGAYPRMEIRPTWSLSVEEQFYAAWPLMLLLMLRLRWSKGAIFGCVAALMAGSAAARAALWNMDGSFDRVYYGLDTHADGLLAGAAAALALAWNWDAGFPQIARACAAVGHAAFVALLLFLCFSGPADPNLLCNGSYAVLNVAMAAMIFCAVTAPWPALSLILEWAPLRWLGKISYSLYLWHLVAFGVMIHIGGISPGWYWPLAVALSLGLAGASFYGIERPFLKLKVRYAANLCKG